MGRISALVVLLWLASASANATPYGIAWEGGGSTAALPEQCGWTRNWGNWEGPHQGGANRTLENGILTYDSLYDGGVYDAVYMDGPIDPDHGELLVMEWRLKVDRVLGFIDPAVAVYGDGAWGVGFGFSEGAIISVFEGHVATPIVPGIFHDYRLTSRDMRTYDLYVDGQLARVGSFWSSATHSYVGWGDSGQSVAGGSRHHWDYFRISVVPEPGVRLSIGMVIACCVGRRR